MSLRHLGRDDHERASAVADHAALEETQRVGDDARVEHLVDGDLADRVDSAELEVVHRLDGLGLRIACARVTTESSANASSGVPYSCMWRIFAIA